MLRLLPVAGIRLLLGSVTSRWLLSHGLLLCAVARRSALRTVASSTVCSLCLLLGALLIVTLLLRRLLLSISLLLALPGLLTVTLLIHHGHGQAERAMLYLCSKYAATKTVS